MTGWRQVERVSVKLEKCITCDFQSKPGAMEFIACALDLGMAVAMSRVQGVYRVRAMDGPGL